ncbi:MAG TPA: DUF695 domain-containing protein [Sphingomicrobium sp.]|jgi:hypothetical protein|nr:DUF695 domain-containing protein [Sphingomicrobium sp.]
MSDKLSIRGDEDGWQVFGKTPPGGNQRLFRSRAGWPSVRSYSLKNKMMRLRCVLRPDQVRDDGMPRSSTDLDDYEDRLLDALTAANAEVYFIASITGDGNRDLFFAMRDPDELRSGIKAAQRDIDTFKLQLAPLGDDKAAFLDALSLSEDQVQAAAAAGRVHDVSKLGGFPGKLFGR